VSYFTTLARYDSSHFVNASPLEYPRGPCLLGQLFVKLKSAKLRISKVRGHTKYSRLRLRDDHTTDSQDSVILGKKTPWEQYNETAQIYDNEAVKEWEDNLSILLVFVSVLSGKRASLSNLFCIGCSVFCDIDSVYHSQPEHHTRR
jgi:hypothetical protein